jgi:hypothetical protein
MEDPVQELLALARGLGFSRSSDGAAVDVSDVQRIMHGVKTTREVTDLSLEYQELDELYHARTLVDQRSVSARTEALRRATDTMTKILRNKSKLVERLRATKMSGTVRVEQQHQRDLKRLLEACAADLHGDDQGADVLQWAVGFSGPTSQWEDRTRSVLDAVQALGAQHQEEMARGALMDELTRGARR